MTHLTDITATMLVAICLFSTGHWIGGIVATICLVGMAISA
jgi:uncharacterized membrane protein